MTFVSKILIVVQLFLSVMFMAFAGAVYTVHTNWKTKVAQVEKDVTQARTQTAEVQQEFDKFKTDTAATIEDVTKRAQSAEAGYTNESQKREQAESSFKKATDELTNQRAVASVATTEANERKKEADELRVINEDLHKTVERLTTEKHNLEQTIFARTVQVANMEERHDKVLDQVELLSKVVRTHGFSTDPKDYRGLEKPPKVDGRVLAVKAVERSGEEFVEISVGSDDGLGKGHEVYVSSTGPNAQYLGKIRLIMVTPDRSVGVVTQKAALGQITRGDNATTQL